MAAWLLKVTTYCSEDEGEGDNEYYGFLNLPRHCSPADISAAYKRLARVYHPDKHQVHQQRSS